MINILQSKASAGAVNLTSDFDNIAINSIKNLSACLKALIFGFQETNTFSTAILQGLELTIDNDKISVKSGVAVTACGKYPFFVNKIIEKKIEDKDRQAVATNDKYLVLRAKVEHTEDTEKRLVKTPEGTYEEQSVYSEQSLNYYLELADTPLYDDLVFGKVNEEFIYTEDKSYPILRLSRTFDHVTAFLDTATNEATKETLMLRDKNGRAKIENPNTNKDIANKDYVDSCISIEAETRKSADETLLSKIGKEATARQDADSEITKRIDGLGITATAYDGNAATATKLTTNAGSAKTPVYFSDGKPVAGTYTLGDACSKTVKNANTQTHCNWKTDKDKIPDMSMLAYWNGAYDSTNNSNLTYCAKGKFGDAATKTETEMNVLSAQYLQLKGTDNIGTANDTPKNWANKGTCVWYFTSNNQLNGQPAQYGVLLNLVTSSDIKQMFFTCSSGDGEIYQRGGLKNNTQWHATGWRKMFDNKNLPSATINVTRMHATATNDLTLSSFDTDAITTGSKTGLNIGIDVNEIQARNNGAAAELNLNSCGGSIVIGTKGKIDGTGLEYNGNAATATKATQDGNGNNIANTYATKAVATTSANGLMSKEDIHTSSPLF